MKLSNDFKGHRLRPRRYGSWRLRIGALLAALLATLGVLLAMASAATLAGRPSVLGPVGDSTAEASAVLAVSLVLLWCGIAGWRYCRRHLNRPGDLSLSPQLLKKRD